MTSFSYSLHQISLLNSKPYAQMLTSYLYHVACGTSNTDCPIYPNLNLIFLFLFIHIFKLVLVVKDSSFFFTAYLYSIHQQAILQVLVDIFTHLFFSSPTIIFLDLTFMSPELLQCLFVSHASSFLQFIPPLVKTSNHTTPMHKILQLFHIV